MSKGSLTVFNCINYDWLYQLWVYGKVLPLTRWLKCSRKQRAAIARKRLTVLRQELLDLEAACTEEGFAIVDLNECKTGDKLLLRNGKVTSYVGRVDSADLLFRHQVKGSEGTYSYRDDGRFLPKEESTYDIVAVLEQQQTY